MSEAFDLNAVLNEIARGQSDGYGRIVSAYALPLRAYLASQVYHLNDVDDLAQEVFLAAYDCLPSFRRGDDFGAWLRGICRNKLLTYYRSESRRTKALQRYREDVVAIIEPDLEALASLDRGDAIAGLLRCISQLPERLRRVVRAGLDGDKPAELATLLSTTVGVIYNLHHRANVLLRECLQKGVV
ncbi:N/A [soil metagenome]